MRYEYVRTYANPSATDRFRYVHVYRRGQHEREIKSTEREPNDEIVAATFDAMDEALSQRTAH